MNAPDRLRSSYGESAGALAKAEGAHYRPLRCYALEAKYELLKQLRMPAYALPAIGFPLMFYLLFGVMFGGARAAGSTTVATYMLATYGAFGVIGAALFGFGVGVAVERGQGWMTLKRATPMPPLAYFFAKLVMATAFSAVIVMLLAIAGITLGGVRLDAAAWARLFGTLLLGAAPFSALGLAIGYFAGPNSSPAIVNLIYMPLAFASGLWIPIEMLPSALKSSAVFLPPYHLAQLALAAVGAGRGGAAWAHVLALIGFALIGIGIALIGYGREEDKTWG
jgi:ABC-2 type transport system permease protein